MLSVKYIANKSANLKIEQQPKAHSPHFVQSSFTKPTEKAPTAPEKETQLFQQNHKIDMFKIYFENLSE